MNKDWPVWIISSIAKHFNSSVNLKMFLEGEPRDTWSDADFMEVRIDGPRFFGQGNGVWNADVFVNILLQSTFDGSDLYKIHRNIGLVCVSFDQAIGIFDGISQVACFKMPTNQELIISHLGRVKPETPLLQATVEGTLEGELA